MVAQDLTGRSGVAQSGTGRPHRVASIRLGAADDASGMAVMLAEVLADNMADYRGRARIARVVRGPVVMSAADHDRSVTVRFTGAEIVIEEGASPGAPVLAGQWSDLAQLCSGRLGPWQAVRSGKLAISTLRRPDLVAAAGYVLSVPASYYGVTPPWRRKQVVIPAVAAGATALIVGWWLPRSRS